MIINLRHPFICKSKERIKKYKNGFWPAVSSVFFDTELIGTRFTLGSAEFFWAIMLFWPGDTFDRPTYHGMAIMMNEELWGVLFLISALCQFAVIVFNQCNTKFGRKFALFNAMLWVYTVTSMLASVYPPPAAVGGEIALMLSAIWISIRPTILESLYHYATKPRES